MTDITPLGVNADELRYLVESTTFIAIRDGVGIASKEGNSITYKDTMAFAERIAPYLFHRDRSLLYVTLEGELARDLRAKANSKRISFVQMVNEEISRYSDFLKDSISVDREHFLKKIRSLKALLQEHADNTFFEGKLIERDASLGSDLPMSRKGDGYYDFGLPSNRLMRIRVTHETNVEAVNGTDLIYEHHDMRNGRARIVVVQYKITGKDRYLDKNPRFRKQLERMKVCFCERLPCLDPNKGKQSFRFPSCTSFVRATNKVQSKNPRIISMGYYMPVCKSLDLWDRGEPLSEESLEGEVIRYRVFEEMFNAGLIGSEWIPYEQLEKLYQEHKILSSSEIVGVHIQTYQEDPYRMFW